MHFRSVAALGALLLSVACEIPVDTSGGNADFGVTSVGIQPKTASVLVGDSLQLSASVIMSNSRPPNSVNWASTDVVLATVSSTGLVHARAAGGLFIRATSGGKRDSSVVTVMDPSPMPVASVALAPSSVTVTVGGTVSLVATLKDVNGNALAGRVITWVSSNPGAATVSGTGLVTAATVGSATITATSEGQSGKAVRGRRVTWARSNGGVATVSASGGVSGVAAGSVTITATSEGHSGTSAVTVTTAAALPGTVSDLAAPSVTDSSATLSFTEVDNGAGQPASYDIRFIAGPTLTWGSSVPGVTRGTCATPVAGTTIGAKRTCTV